MHLVLNGEAMLCDSWRRWARRVYPSEFATLFCTTTTTGEYLACYPIELRIVHGQPVSCRVGLSCRLSPLKSAACLIQLTRLGPVPTAMIARSRGIHCADRVARTCACAHSSKISAAESSNLSIAFPHN